MYYIIQMPHHYDKWTSNPTDLLNSWIVYDLFHLSDETQPKLENIS